MKKKIVSVLLAATMVLTVCACGSNKEVKKPVESSETPKVESSETKQVESEPTGEESLYPLVDSPVTVKAVYVGVNNSEREDRIVWNKVSEITGLNIEWEVIAPEAFATYLAGGDWPDLIHGAISNEIIYDYGVLGGRFVDYNEYLDIMPNLVQTMEDYPLVKKASVMSNGGMYRICRVDNSATATAVRPHIYTTVLENAGVEVPTTVEEFEQALKDLKEFYGVPSFIPSLNQYKNCWAPMLYAAFGTGCNMVFDVDDQGEVYFAGMSDQMRHYYEYMNSLYEQELIHQECVTLDSTAKRELEFSGKVAFLETAAGYIEQDENGVWPVSTAIPFTSEYDETREVLGSTFVYSGSGLLINTESDYVEELVRMVDICFATEEVVEGSGLYGISFMYGMEGEHWDYDGNGETYTFHTPEGYDSFGAFQGAEIMWLNFGRADALAGLITSTPSNNQARQMAYVENIFPYMEEDPFPMDFLVFTEEQQYVIDSKWTEIDSYVKKMQVEFITGVTDIAEGWEVYCNTLEKMGISEVRDVYQEAYETLMSE